MINERTQLIFLMQGNYDYDFKLNGIVGQIGLYKDLKKEGDGIFWGMKRASVIKSSYTDVEIAQGEKLAQSKPIKNGEIVCIINPNPEETNESGFYRVEILGNYSTACLFHKVCGIDGE